MSTERTALYRLFDTSGALLYVGITNDTDTRWKAHSRRKEWWPQVDTKTVEWFGDRLSAASAEAKAIREEQPRWNLARPDETDPFRWAGGIKGGGRPSTGQTRVITFRPKSREFLAEFDATVEEGRSRSDVLIELMHDRVAKKQRERKATVPERPVSGEEKTG